MIIIVSSLKLVWDTYLDPDSTDPKEMRKVMISNYLDISFNIIFGLESFVKATAFGFTVDKHSYLRDSWN